MAVTNYLELLAAGANWLHRADLTDRLPEFVSLTEAKMFRLLKTAEMEATATLTATDGVAALPTGFMSARRLRILIGGIYQPIQIIALSPYQSGVSATPIAASIQGSNLILNPAGSGTLSLDYLAKFTPLSTSTPTNWILTNHPDVYLYGMLGHSAPFLGADGRLAVWAQLFVDGMEDINKADARKRFNNIQMRTDVPTRRNYYNINTDQ